MVTTQLYALEKELRGTWIAWAGTDVPSTSEIASTMEQLAEANFNIVYVDVWRYGYPYFRSEVFKKLTRLETDPGIENYQQPQRDVLAEMIVEAHRVGLEVEAWFESGFNGALNTYSPLYGRKPEWFAKRRDGSLAEYGQAGLSLVQCLPEVQQFLIDFCQEVIMKYDVDGVDMDRIRYPELDCGYDDYTVNLYKSEHDGVGPPQNISDAGWMQWRADQLTDFVGRMYDSLKVIHPDIHVTNAPLPWGPEQFCQDWAPWINMGYLDIVIPQMYQTTNASFIWRLNRELAFVDNDRLVYPGISTTANGAYTTAEELVNQINTCRDYGLEGHVIWYHNNLLTHANNYIDALVNNVYPEKAEIPYRDPAWKRAVIIIDESADHVVKTAGWKSYSGSIPLYENACLYTQTGNSDTITYFATIPRTGYYEAYYFINTQANANSNTAVNLLGHNYEINQSIYGNSGRWEKLGDIYLDAGENQKLLALTANTGDGKFAFADALMLIETRRPARYLPTALKNSRKMAATGDFHLYQSYPNPFNFSTKIHFDVHQSGRYQIAVMDITGACVAVLADRHFQPGEYRLDFSRENLASGVYFTRLESENNVLIRKMTLLK